MKRTNWNNYYENRNTNIVTKLARKTTSKKVSRLVALHAKYKPKVSELGGGDSCIADELIETTDASLYEIVDNCQKGLDLFSKRRYTCPTKSTLDSVLEKSKQDTFDVTVSVGLIEHFDVNDTEKAIAYHFKKVKKGGIVLITFPHPTLLYRIARKILEIMGRWSFPDERPLSFDEVNRVCCVHGVQLHQSINWYTILTQGYVVYKKTD